MSQILSTTALTHEQQHYNNLVITSGKNLQNVIDDILDFSKIEAGKLDIVEDTFSLTKLLSHTYGLFDRTSQGKAYRFLHVP